MTSDTLTHRLWSINTMLDLHMSDTEMQMLESAFRLLQQVQRYKGGVHLPQGQRDNTCDHTLASVRLAAHLFADATLGDTALKKDIISMILVHDIGESFGEFTSLDSRVKAAKRFKIGKRAERSITDFVLSWAVHYQHDPNAFLAMMQPIQTLVSGANTPEAMAEIALEYVENLGLPKLDADNQQTVDTWMHYFDEVEGLADRSFTGSAAKMIEKLQSQEHFAHHCGKDGSIPFDQATSASVVATLSYAERKLGDVFAFAKTDEQKALAQELRDRCYHTIMQMIDKIPPVVNMQQPERVPEAGSEGRASFTQKLLEQHRGLRESRYDSPLCVETRYRIKEWYQTAIRGGYTPKPGESLIDRYLNPQARIALGA